MSIHRRVAIRHPRSLYNSWSWSLSRSYSAMRRTETLCWTRSFYSSWSGSQACISVSIWLNNCYSETGIRRPT